MPKNLPKEITDFISEHHVLTLATNSEENIWCASCFYAFDNDSNSFIFSSDTDTIHGATMLQNNKVAGNIVLETETVGKIQGLQFSGIATLLEDDKLKAAKKIYLKRFPYAILKKTCLWSFEIKFAKLTDNKLGFGKKLIWE